MPLSDVLRMGRSGLGTVIESLSDWTILLPLVAIGGTLIYFGFKLVYLAALIVGVFAWNYWGRRMAFSDPKLALVVNVEEGTVAPLFIGRKRWSDATKTGRPGLAFRTPGGLSVEILKSYDVSANVAEYPDDIGFSDLMIAAVPKRYGELIDEYAKLQKELMQSRSEASVEAVKIARKHISNFSALMDEIMSPSDSVTEKAEEMEKKEAAESAGV